MSEIKVVQKYEFDGKLFDDLETAEQYKESKLGMKIVDNTFQHGFKTGDTVYIARRKKVRECQVVEVVIDGFEDTDLEDENNPSIWIKESRLILKDLREDGEEFHYYGEQIAGVKKSWWELFNFTI